MTLHWRVLVVRMVASERARCLKKSKIIEPGVSRNRWVSTPITSNEEGWETVDPKKPKATRRGAKGARGQGRSAPVEQGSSWADICG